MAYDDEMDDYRAEISASKPRENADFSMAQKLWNDACLNERDSRVSQKAKALLKAAAATNDPETLERAVEDVLKHTVPGTYAHDLAFCHAKGGLAKTWSKQRYFQLGLLAREIERDDPVRAAAILQGFMRDHRNDPEIMPVIKATVEWIAERDITLATNIAHFRFATEAPEAYWYEAGLLYLDMTEKLNMYNPYGADQRLASYRMYLHGELSEGQRDEKLIRAANDVDKRISRTPMPEEVIWKPKSLDKKTRPEDGNEEYFRFQQSFEFFYDSCDNGIEPNGGDLLRAARGVADSHPAEAVRALEGLIELYDATAELYKEAGFLRGRIAGTWAMSVERFTGFMRSKALAEQAVPTDINTSPQPGL